MKVKDLRQLSDEELSLELERLRRHLFDVRTQAVTEKLEDPTMVTKVKRDVARILTVQQERRSAARAQQELPAGAGAAKA